MTAAGNDPMLNTLIQVNYDVIYSRVLFANEQTTVAIFVNGSVDCRSQLN